VKPPGFLPPRGTCAQRRGRSCLVRPTRGQDVILLGFAIHFLCTLRSFEIGESLLDRLLSMWPRASLMASFCRCLGQTDESGRCGSDVISALWRCFFDLRDTFASKFALGFCGFLARPFSTSLRNGGSISYCLAGVFHVH